MKQYSHSDTEYQSTLQGALTAFFVLLICALITYGVMTWRAQKHALLEASVQQNAYISAGSEDFLAGVGYGIDAIANTVRESHTTEYANAMWATLHSSHPEIESLLLTDKTGHIQFTSDANKTRRDPAELRNLFDQDAIAGRRFNIGLPSDTVNPADAEIRISHMTHDGTGIPTWRVESTVKLKRLIARWEPI